MSTRGSKKKSAKKHSSSRNKAIVTVPRSLDNLVPRELVTHLRYVDQYQLTPTTTLVMQSFRGNSMHDFDYTGTGHQPMGYDQLCPTLYGEWVVTAVNVKATFQLSTTVVANVGVNRQDVAMFWVPNDTTLPTTSIQLLENHNCKWKRLTGYQNKCQISTSCNFPKLFGRTLKEYLASPDFVGQSGSNPPRWGLLNVACCTAIAGADTSAGVVEFTLEADFTVHFRSPVVLGVS